MKMLTIILSLIVVLGLIGIIVLYYNLKEKDLSQYAVLAQAIATFLLVIITAFYAIEARLSRMTQQDGFDRYIKELQESRRQQLKPYVYLLFYWGGDTFGNKFFAILKNLGTGPAFDINYSYSVIDDKGKTIKNENKCPALSANTETADNTPFSLEHINMKNKVRVDIAYKDSFGETINDTFELSLRELVNNPPPLEFSEKLRRIEQEDSSFVKSARIQAFMGTFKKLQEEVSQIKDILKNK